MKKYNPFLFKIQCIFDHKIVGPYLIQRKKKFHEQHESPPRVNIGGGNFLRHDWVNMDYPSKWYPYKEGVVDCKYDLTSSEPLSFKDNSIELFYSSGCMEHIPSESFEHIFSEIYRSLKPGGGIRITVPDYDMLYDTYQKRMKDEQEGLREILDTFLNGFASYFKGRVPVNEFQKNFETMSRSELANHYCSQVPRDLHKDTAGHHINWWNFEKMKNKLEKANFSEVTRTEPFESRFPEFNKRVKMFGLEHVFSLQSMLEFDCHASEITGEPEESLYVDAVK